VLPIRCVLGRRNHAVPWLGLSLLVSQLSAAQESPATFELPASCGSEAEFRRELVALTGKDADRAWPTSLRITADPSSPGYRLTLEHSGTRRELEHLDCRVLFRSALVISAASVGSAHAPPEPAPAAPPPLPERASAAPTERSDEPLAVRGTVALGSGVALGVVPGPTAAFEARVGGTIGGFGASLAFRHFVPRYVAVGGRGADIGGYGLRFAAVYAPRPWLSGSLGLDADWLVGRGRVGIAVPLEDSAWTLAPSLELAVAPVATRHWSVELAAAGRYAVVRPVFEVTGFGQIFRPPGGSLFAVARGVFHFP
jgi:hypothetical protein